MRGFDADPIGRILLDAVDDAVHRHHGFERILARRRFRGQHDRVDAIVDRVRHIGDFGARRNRCVDHRFHHLRGHDHGFARLAARANDAPLQFGYLFRRQFDAQVAARHHDAVDALDDTFQVIDRRGLLELGHDPRSIADQFACLGDVFGTLYKRQRDPVDALRKPELQIGSIFGGERGDR